MLNFVKMLVVLMAVALLSASSGYAVDLKGLEDANRQREREGKLAPDSKEVRARVCADIKAGRYQELPLLTLKEAGYTLSQAVDMYQRSNMPFDKSTYDTEKIIALVDLDNNNGEKKMFARVSSDSATGVPIARFREIANKGWNLSDEAGLSISSDSGLRSQKIIHHDSRYYIAWISKDAKGQERIDRVALSYVLPSFGDIAHMQYYCDFMTEKNK